MERSAVLGTAVKVGVGVGVGGGGVTQPWKRTLRRLPPLPFPLGVDSDCAINCPVISPFENSTAAVGASTVPRISNFFILRLDACGKFQSTWLLSVPVIVSPKPRSACTPVTLMITVDPAGTLMVVVNELSSTSAGTAITFTAESVPVIVTDCGCAVYVPFAEN